MTGSILNQAFSAWQKLTAEGYDLFARVGGESPFRLNALRGLYAWIEQSQSCGPPFSSTLDRKATTFCLFEFAHRGYERPELVPIGVAALMMAISSHEPIEGNEADLYEDAIRGMAQRFLYNKNGTTLEDCLELRFFISIVLEADLADRRLARAVRILMDAAVLHHLVARQFEVSG